MNLVKRNKIPLYVQIKNTIRQDIQVGKLKPGMRVPSENELIAEYNVSSTTAIRALNDLLHEGLIYRLQGKGTFVANPISREAKIVSKIGLVVSEIENPFFVDIIKYTESYVREKGYSTVLYVTDGSLNEIKKAIFLFEEEKSAGLIIGPVYCGKELNFMASIKKEKIPVVIFRCLEPVEIDYVTTDCAKGAYEAVCHLINLGHKKIAYLGIPEEAKWAKFSGYSQALLDKGIKIDKSLVVECRGVEADGYNVAKALFNREPDITAVFAHNDLAAIGVIKAVHETGRKVPDDIAVIGFDDIEFAKYVEVPLTTVSQPRRKLAKKVVEALDRRIRYRDRIEPQHIVLETSLIIRNSCGAKV